MNVSVGGSAVPVSMHSNHISNSVIFSNNNYVYVSLLSDLCTCVQLKMALQMKP